MSLSQASQYDKVEMHTLELFTVDASSLEAVIKVPYTMDIPGHPSRFFKSCRKISGDNPPHLVRRRTGSLLFQNTQTEPLHSIRYSQIVMMTLCYCRESLVSQDSSRSRYAPG